MLRIAHIALSVSNISKSSAFYRKHFGFRQIEKFFKPGGLIIALLQKDSVFIELFQFKKHKPLPAYRKSIPSDLITLGTKHLALDVHNIKAMYQRLESSKVKFATEICTLDNGRKYFFLKDPDGILVEIMEAR